jgi:hypothetical protein
MNVRHFDARGAKTANSVRAVVAGLFVLGLTSLVWVHHDRQEPTTATAATTSNQFLHAPSTDPSLPDLRATMRQADTAYEVVQPPTF